MNPQAIEHIKIMKKMLENHGIKTRIQADGNVNSNTIKTLFDAGATIFTGGTSGLFIPNKTIRENLNNLLKPLK